MAAAPEVREPMTVRKLTFAQADRELTLSWADKTPAERLRAALELKQKALRLRSAMLAAKATR